MFAAMQLFSSVVASMLLCLFTLECGGQDYSELALQKAIAYVEGRGERLYPMMVPTLYHLKQEYKLQVNTTAQELEIRQRNKKRRNPFLRELDPETEILREDISKLSGIDRTTAVAMHCDLFGLPKNYLADLRRQAAQGNYALTHATLSLLLAGWRRCLPNDERFQRELQLQYRELTSLLRRIAPQSDLGVETMLMLLLSGKNLKPPARFDSALLTQLLEAQWPNGSWNGDDHTTVLAMWVILEARSQGITIKKANGA
ncbi:MAG: hypothetical protein OHK0011_15120 [Turneriella sp.]